MSIHELHVAETSDSRFSVERNIEGYDFDPGAYSAHLDQIGIDSTSKPIKLSFLEGVGSSRKPTYLNSALDRLTGAPLEVERFEQGGCVELDDAIDIFVRVYSADQANSDLIHETSHALDILYPEGLSDYDREYSIRKARAAIYLGTFGVASTYAAYKLNGLAAVFTATANYFGGEMYRNRHSHEVRARRAQKEYASITEPFLTKA